MKVVEPKADEFFVTASGVCVYVNIERDAVRVVFTSADGPVFADGNDQGRAATAVAVATKTFEQNKGRLEQLFTEMAREQAKRS